MRLTADVAPWRNPGEVASAVRGWIESSLAQSQNDARSHGR
jgi:hypothetical protein